PCGGRPGRTHGRSSRGRGRETSPRRRRSYPLTPRATGKSTGLPAGFDLAVLLLGPVHAAVRLAVLLGRALHGGVAAGLGLGGVGPAVGLAHLLGGPAQLRRAGGQRQEQANGQGGGGEQVSATHHRSVLSARGPLWTVAAPWRR